jgi:hypothetical protein
MAYRIPDRGPIPDNACRRLEPIAAQHAVSISRLIEVIRARRRFRRAVSYRKRARRRALEKNPRARKFRFRAEPLLAGEGELHALLHAASLSEADFCSLSGIDRSVLFRWYGHCLHRWPTVLLEYYAWATNMASFLASKGWDPEQFRPVPPSPARAGRYPRTAEDGKRLLAATQPARINCPIHGWQTALGGECPKC